MSIEDKIKAIFKKRRWENYVEEVRRARVYLLMDLFMRGYQNVGAWNDMQGWPVYDEDPMSYVENRFRRNVLINAGGLIRMEPPPVLRPASGAFNDIEAAGVAQDVWEKAKDEIAYDSLLTEKSIQKCLFGTTFIYSGYQFGGTDKIMVPKMKYEDIEIPGMAACPQCGMTSGAETPVCPECGMNMQNFPPIPSKSQVVDGYDEREKGELFSTAFSPLEIKIRARVKGGPKRWPYLFRTFREDADYLNYIYPDLNIQPNAQGTGPSAPSADASMRYQEMLANLPGNPYGNQTPFWSSTSEFADVDVIMGWIKPQLYEGDEELLKAAPDGLMGVMCGDQMAEWRPEKLEDVWTYEVYYPNVHSAYGDGMFDDIPIQRGINQVGQLTMRHFEYDTIPLRLYDDTLILTDPNNIGNDPKKKWIPVNTTLERGLETAVRDLSAQALSFDVNILRQDLRQVDQTISGATDPRAGQIAGANTPYSAQILAVEQGQTLFLPSSKFNKPAIRDHVRIVLNLAKKNWTDPRTLAEADQNTGRTSWKTFVGADLSRGNWNVYVMDTDFKPKTRGEVMQAMAEGRNMGIDFLGSPKLRMKAFENLGIPADGDMVSTQAKRASRIIEKFRTNQFTNPATGQLIQPDAIIDDGIIQFAVFQEFLASDEGDDFAQDNPQAFELLKQYAWTGLQIAAMRNAAFGPAGLPPAGPQMMPDKPQPGPPGPQQPKQEHAQSPVPPGQQQPLPTSPARQEQASQGAM
jgi:hypothetical protein